jgi:hypothetical protein
MLCDNGLPPTKLKTTLSLVFPHGPLWEQAVAMMELTAHWNNYCCYWYPLNFFLYSQTSDSFDVKDDCGKSVG